MIFLGGLQKAYEDFLSCILLHVQKKWRGDRISMFDNVNTLAKDRQSQGRESPGARNMLAGVMCNIPR